MRVRSALISIVFFISSFSVSAEIVRFYTPEKQWSFITGLSLENGKDFDPNTTAVDFSANLDMKQILANVGMKFQASQLDFSTEIVYWPEFWGRANFGVGSVFHTNYYHDVFLETDYLVGFYAGYHTERKFDCMLNFCYMRKSARIFAIEDDVPWLNNNTIAFKTEFNFRPVQKLNIFAALSSYTQYRYMLFLAPDFKLGAEYMFLPVFSLGGQIEVQYIDMFTLSSNLNSIDLRLYSRIMLR